jgi:hypothetical protein
MRTGFRKCASWKTPTIPSKMRRLLQDAHVKLRIFAERSAESVCRGHPFQGALLPMRDCQ